MCWTWSERSAKIFIRSQQLTQIILKRNFAIVKRTRRTRIQSKLAVSSFSIWHSIHMIMLAYYINTMSFRIAERIDWWKHALVLVWNNQERYCGMRIRRRCFPNAGQSAAIKGVVQIRRSSKQRTSYWICYFDSSYNVLNIININKEN